MDPHDGEGTGGGLADLTDMLLPLHSGGVMHSSGIQADVTVDEWQWGDIPMVPVTKSDDKMARCMALMRARAMDALDTSEMLEYVASAMLEIRRPLVTKRGKSSPAMVLILLASKGHTVHAISMPGAASSEIKHMWSTIELMTLRDEPNARAMAKWAGGRTSNSYYQAIEALANTQPSDSGPSGAILDEELLEGRMINVLGPTMHYYLDDILRSSLADLIADRLPYDSDG